MYFSFLKNKNKETCPELFICCTFYKEGCQNNSKIILIKRVTKISGGKIFLSYFNNWGIMLIHAHTTFFLVNQAARVLVIDISHTERSSA